MDTNEVTNASNDKFYNSLSETFENLEKSLNKHDDSLPYGYYCPESNGDVYWMCNYDHENKIVGVFANSKNKSERQVDFFPTLVEAQKVREELIKHGWQKMKMPKISLTVPDGNGKQREISRKEKRFIQREADKYLKKNFKNNNFISLK